jgi:tRNA splicing ligase
MLEVAESWEKNSDPKAVQVFGHRNVTESPVRINSKSYNLQGNIEFGGNLRAVTFNILGEREVWEIPNTVFRPKNIKVETTLGPSSFVEDLRKSRHINERKFGDISSFNFNRGAFYKKIWDGMTVKARGLFVNTVTNEIVARSYNKFFNVNEREETRIETVNLQYPVHVYEKYNGFLGMVGYDTASDSVLFLSKSSVEGIYPDIFKRVWALTTNVDPDHLKAILKDHNITLVFEVIDQDDDPHIIAYPDRQGLILLDAVRRSLDYEKLPYQEMLAFAHSLNMPERSKQLYKTLNSKEELLQFYRECETATTSDIEGFVFEDSNGFMMKLKLPYYNFWKHMRVVKDAVRARRQVNLSALTTPEANYFYAWLKTRTEEELSRDIITLRNMYYKEKGA